MGLIPAVVLPIVAIILVRAVTRSSQGICIRVHIIAEVILTRFAVEAVSVIIVALLVIREFAHVVAVRRLAIGASRIESVEEGIIVWKIRMSKSGEGEDFVVGGGGGVHVFKVSREACERKDFFIFFSRPIRPIQLSCRV